MQFGNAIYRGVHEKSNITASFMEHQQFRVQMTFKLKIWVNSDKSKQNN